MVTERATKDNKFIPSDISRNFNNNMNPPLPDINPKIIFWDVSGFKNITDLADYINESDVICLSETWLSEAPTSRPKWLSDYTLTCVNATKDIGKCRG